MSTLNSATKSIRPRGSSAQQSNRDRRYPKAAQQASRNFAIQQSAGTKMPPWGSRSEAAGWFPFAKNLAPVDAVCEFFPVAWCQEATSYAMETYILLLMIGLQAKHLAADYLLQPRWMVFGKGSIVHPGGYAHAGVHVLGTLPVLLFAGISASFLAALVAGEAVAHYMIDFTKARWAKARPADVSSRAFWVAQGTDQFMHQLTYALMIFLILVYGDAAL